MKIIYFLHIGINLLEQGWNCLPSLNISFSTQNSLSLYQYALFN